MLFNKNSVTSDMMYSLKNSAGTSRRYRASIPPSNFSTNIPPSSNLIFSIPCGRKNTYLDGQNSYLKLTIKNTDATANRYLNLDGCGASVINMLTLYHSGNLIDQCPNYNTLFNYLMDFQSNFSQHVGGLSAYLGTSSNVFDTTDLTVMSNGVAVGANVNIGSVRGSFTSTRAGMYIPSVGGAVTVCLPLLNSIFLNSDKMIPLGKLKSALELQVLLETLIKGVVSPSATVNFVVQYAELVLEIIELSDTSQQIVDSMSPSDQPIYIHTNEWRYFSNSLPAATTGLFSSLISACYNSLKTLVCLPQLSATINDQTSYSCSSRINPNIIPYQFRIGGSIIANKMVVLRNDNTTGGFGEAYVEILKSFHGLNNLQYNQLIGGTLYNIWDQAASNVLGIKQGLATASSYQNGFALAQELEVYSSRNDVLLHGINTIGQNIFHDITIDTTGPTAAYTLNYFANFDASLVIENGIMRVVF